MSKRALICPHCDSAQVRLAGRKSGWRSRLRRFSGLHHFRCNRCGKRFESRTIHREYVWYAKCPLCAGLELVDWQEKYYYPPFYKRMFVYVGGKEQRCGACRYNFVSFRPRWKGEKKNGPK